MPLPQVLRWALSEVARPQQVRWQVATSAAVAADQAPGLARAVAELVNAASDRGKGVAVLVRAEQRDRSIDIALSDGWDGPGSGQLALGSRPQALLALIRGLGASLAATPSQSGHGTDTHLSLPAEAPMH
jgi:hypothetical protein